MSRLGLGVMIQRLAGNSDARDALEHAIGRVIKSIAMIDDTLHIELDSGKSLVLSDDGQSCCESRYMTCDDDLTGYDGATLMEVEVRDAPSIDDPDGSHEVQFLVVTTSKGAITVATHNEHNGYYGGFAIAARLV